MAYRNYANNVGFIVNPNGSGDFTTITAASAAATSGMTIFIAPGTYTEDVPGKAGITYSTMTGCDATPSVTVIGKWTFSTAGVFTIANLRLQTNSDYFLELTGSSVSQIFFHLCEFACTNNTGIHFTTTNTLSQIYIDDCLSDITTTGITFYNMTGTGNIAINNTYLGNTANTTVATTQSAGTVNMYYTHLDMPIANSGTGITALWHCTSITGGSNTPGLALGGTVGGLAVNYVVSSGTASSITIAAGATLTLTAPAIASSNTNAIAGAGTLNTRNIVYFGSSSTIEGTLTVNTLVGFP